jgi:hypothetical protein
MLPLLSLLLVLRSIALGVQQIELKNHADYVASHQLILVVDVEQPAFGPRWYAVAHNALGECLAADAEGAAVGDHVAAAIAGAARGCEHTCRVPDLKPALHQSIQA